MELLDTKPVNPDLTQSDLFTSQISAGFESIRQTFLSSSALLNEGTFETIFSKMEISSEVNGIPDEMCLPSQARYGIAFATKFHSLNSEGTFDLKFLFIEGTDWDIPVNETEILLSLSSEVFIEGSVTRPENHPAGGLEKVTFNVNRVLAAKLPVSQHKLFAV
jgi:hypothetical protein